MVVKAGLDDVTHFDLRSPDFINASDSRQRGALELLVSAQDLRRTLSGVSADLCVILSDICIHVG